MMAIRRTGEGLTKFAFRSATNGRLSRVIRSATSDVAAKANANTANRYSRRVMSPYKHWYSTVKNSNSGPLIGFVWAGTNQAKAHTDDVASAARASGLRTVSTQGHSIGRVIGATSRRIR